MNVRVKHKRGRRAVALLLVLCILCGGGAATLISAAESDVSGIEAQIASIGTVTYKSGSTVKAVRAAFDALDAELQAQVRNYQILLDAEAEIQALSDAFQVTVTGWSSNSFSRTPWMESGSIGEADRERSRLAMADEMKYQYIGRGYRLGIIQGGKAIDNWSSYALGFGIDDNQSLNDNVGNPWDSSDTRHWAFVSTAFAGIAFSECGYMSAGFSYSTPISNSFTYDGRVYQMFTAGIRSHEDVPLVKDTKKNTRITVTASTTLRAGGKNEDVTNNTFTYAYARYNQAHKWENKVVGIPTEAADPQLASGVLYKAFVGPDGDAYIAGDNAYITGAEAAAKKMDGNQTGAYVIAGQFARILQSLGEDMSERFEKTGSPTSDEYVTEAGVRQDFLRGYMLVSDAFTGFVERGDADMVREVEAQIGLLPELDDLKAGDTAEILAARKVYDQLREDLKSSVTNVDRLLVLEARLVDLQAAAQVEAAIAALPDAAGLKIAGKAAVQKVKALYTALTDRQHDFVSNITVLTTAEARISALEMQVRLVEAQLAALPVPDALAADKLSAVREARAAFDALTSEQQALVTMSEKLWLLEEKAALLEDTPWLESALYTILQDVGLITGVSANTAPDRFLEGFNLTNLALEAQHENVLSTGDVLKIMDGSMLVGRFTIVVSGDLDGDGKVTVSDVVELRAAILGGRMDTLLLAAGDLAGDGQLTVSDVVDLRTLILRGVA